MCKAACPAGGVSHIHSNKIFTGRCPGGGSRVAKIYPYGSRLVRPKRERSEGTVGNLGFIGWRDDNREFQGATRNPREIFCNKLKMLSVRSGVFGCLNGKSHPACPTGGDRRRLELCRPVVVR